MNKKGQVGDVLEFKFGTVIFLVLFVIAIILFHAPELRSYLFGSENIINVKLPVQLESVQRESLYQKVLIGYLNDDSPVGDNGDLVASRDVEGINKQFLLYSPYTLILEYSDGEIVNFGESAEVLTNTVFLPEFNDKKMAVYLVEGKNE